MKLTAITTSRSRKVNLGNYESADAFASATVELEPGDNPATVWNWAWATVQRQIIEQVELIKSGDKLMPIVRLQSRTRATFPSLGSIYKGSPKGTSTRGKWQGGDDLDYFRVELNDDELQAQFEELYGDKPTAIRCMLMADDIDEVFSAWQEVWNGRGECTHRCDGETIVYPREQRGKPCQSTECAPRGRLYIWLYELPRVGLVTSRTGSKYDIVGLTGNLHAIAAVAGQLNNIPLVLRRDDREIVNKITGKKETKSLLSLEIDGERWQSPALASDDDTIIVDTETGEIYDEPDPPQSEARAAAERLAPSGKTRLGAPSPLPRNQPAAERLEMWWGDEKPTKPTLGNRPWEPAEFRGALRYTAYQKAFRGGDGTADNGLRDLMIAEVDKLVGGGRADRIDFLRYIWGIKESANELTQRQVGATLDWVTGDASDDHKRLEISRVLVAVDEQRSADTSASPPENEEISL